MSKKIIMTFDEFDKAVEKFQKMEFKCEDWLPTTKQIDYYLEHSNDKKTYLLFLNWIIETYTVEDGPKKEEKEKEFSKIEKYINHILIENLELIS